MENKEIAEGKKLNIYKKLQKARVELQNCKLKKTGKNDYSKYEYFELGDFLPSINKICEDLGLCNIFEFNKNEANLTIIDADDPTQKLIFSTPVELANLKGCADIQNIGGTQTYCRRYLYIMAYEIAENDVLDNGEREIDEGSLRIGKAQVDTIRKILVETDSDIKSFLSWANVKRIEDITNRNLPIIMKKIEEKKKEYLEKVQEKVAPTNNEDFEF